MQKHLLALAAGVATLAFTTTAFAQAMPSSKTVDSAITVNTDGAGEAYLLQKGNGNQAGISQTKSGNKVGRKGSSGPTVTGQNIDTLTGLPSGSFNPSQALQTVGSDVTGFYQLGDRNLLTINQTGEKNEVLTGKYSDVSSSGYTGTGSAQKGNDNSANLNQNGNNGVISLLQVGDDNGRNQAGNRFDSVTQGGESAQAVIRQDGNHNLFNINQTGTDNYSNVKQTNNGYVDDFGNYSRIDQSGTRGTVRVTQERTIGGGADGNRVEATQSSTDASFSAQQSGAANRAVSNQYGGQYQYAGVHQEGIGNLATMSQGGNNEYSLIYQSGNANTASTTQTGEYNLAVIYQGESGQTASITQNNYGEVAAIAQFGGTGNNATITQNLQRVHAAVAQVGSSNVATISQR